MTSVLSGLNGRSFVELTGVRLRVFTHDGGVGQRQADHTSPTLVLVHGAGGSYLQWPPQIRRMSGIRIVVPDLPGHGESTGGACKDIQSYARILGELVEVLGISPCVVAGHSMGGAIALEVAHQKPHDVAGIGVLAAGERTLIPQKLIAFVCDQVGESGDASSRPAFTPAATQPVRDQNEQWIFEADRDLLCRDFLASRTFDARPYAPELDMPALIVAGSEDRIVSLAASRSLQQRMPSSEFHELDGAGHMFLWDWTDDVSRLLRRLVARSERYSRCHMHTQIDKV